MKKIELPQRKHCENLDSFLLEAIVAYDLISEKMIKEILDLLKEEGLYKSNLDKEKQINMIKLPFNSINKTIEKYLLPLKWMFLGKAAGKKAEDAVEGLRLKTKIPAGIIYSSFLDSIDAQRMYKKKLDSSSNVDIPATMMKIFFDSVKNKSKKYVENNLDALKNSILQTIEDSVNQVNMDNLSSINKKHHSGESFKKKALRPDVLKVDLKDVFNKYSKKYESLVNTETAMASSVGSYVGVQSLFSEEDDGMRVAIVSVLDDRCCDACDRISRRKDGNINLYRLDQVKPAGYNFKKSKKVWEPSVPPFHPNCRCTLVYVPKGFTIDKEGTIWPGGQNESDTSDKS